MRALSQSVLFAVLAGLTAPGCSDDPILETPDKEVRLMRRGDNAVYYIETYEASKKDATMESEGVDDVGSPRSLERRRPWVEITWEGARTACQSKGKRLCEADEWIDACDGIADATMGSKYTYGDTLDAAVCNTSAMDTEYGGARSGCKSSVGTYDQSGNVWEWTGNILATAATRGGGYRSTQAHECMSGDGVQLFAPTEASREVGFRCCRD